MEAMPEKVTAGMGGDQNHPELEDKLYHRSAAHHCGDVNLNPRT